MKDRCQLGLTHRPVGSVDFADMLMCTFTIVSQYDLGNAHGIEKLISPKKHLSDEVIHVAGRLQTKKQQ